MSEENKEKNKPALYIFKKDSEGKTVNVGAAFRQVKGNGYNIVIGEDRYVAYPPKGKLMPV